MKQRVYNFLGIFLCIFAAGFTLYFHIDRDNRLTALRLALPELEKKVRLLQQKNERLQYDVDRFESPIHLMELLRKPEYSHLKYPHAEDVVILEANE